MQDLLSGLNKELARYLGAQLECCSKNYWQTHVLPKLTENQRIAVHERGRNRLSQLDVSALLRVMDMNWFEISAHANLPREGRNWLKELQTIRNKWAHMGAENPAPEDNYRDTDTLLRFLGIIGADAGLISATKARKDQALHLMTPPKKTSGDNLKRTTSKQGAGRRGSVYDPLRDFLQNRQSDYWETEFSEIEDLLGRPLPASASKYPAWWANQTRDNPVQAKSWMSVGWRVDAVDFERRLVSFRRIR